MFLPRKANAAAIQTIASVVGNLICLNFGVIFGVTPSHVELYQTFETPLNQPCDSKAATWVCSHLFLGTAIGSVLAGISVHRIGPKAVLLISGLLQTCGWFCIHFGYDIIHIYSSRLFIGVASGAGFTVLPIYIQEISQANCNTLIMTTNLFSSVGIFIGYLLGFHVHYDYVPFVGIAIATLFTMSFPFVQESPYYYLHKGNIPSMEKSLRWFRGIRDIDDHEKPEYVNELREFKSLKMIIDAQKSTVSVNAYLRSWKVIILCLVIALSMQLTGTYVILSYFTEINEFNVEQYALIPAGVQVLGALIAVCIATKIRNLSIFCIASFMCALVLIAIPFVSNGPNGVLRWSDMSSCAPWLLLGLVSVHFFIANIGITPFVAVLIGQLLAKRLRSNVASIIMAFSWLLGLLLIQGFHLYTSWLDFIDCAWVFGGCCLAIGVAVFCFSRQKNFETQSVMIESSSIYTEWSTESSIDIKNGHI